MVWFNVGLLLLILAAAEIFQSRRGPSGETKPPGVEMSGSYTLPGHYFADHEILGSVPREDRSSRSLKRRDGKPVYDVVYTIDVNGRRLPPPDHGGSDLPCVAFFGGSFTFGEGVDDEETMPCRVGLKTGGRFRILNYGFHGYGAHHMLAVLQIGRVEESLDCDLRHVIYWALPSHAGRAAGRVSWKAGPKYVMVPGGGVELAGTFEKQRAEDHGFLTGLALKSHLASRAVERLRETDDARLMVELVEASRREVANRFPECDFHVLFWDAKQSGRRIARGLRERGIPVHPVEDFVPGLAQDEASYTLSRYDLHPNARLHERVAEYVSREIITPRATPRPDRDEPRAGPAARR